MKTGTLYGVVAVMAVHAQLTQLVLATEINISCLTGEDSSFTLHLNQAFNENVQIFTNAVNEYKISLLSSNTRAIRLKRTVSTTPSPTKTGIIPEKDVDEIIRDISILKNSSSLNPQEKKNMTVLLTSIKTLQESMKNQNKEILTKRESELYEKSQFVIETFYVLEFQLDIMQKREEEEWKRRLSDDIVRHIESDEFSLAAQKLKNATDGNYVYAVRKVYDHRVENFRLLLTFVDAVEDAGQKLKIYNALFNEMKLNDHMNSQMMSDLSERIKSEIHDSATDSTSFKAQSLLDMVCTQDIVRHLQSNQFSLVQQRLQMGNNNTYAYAVRKVYHHPGDSFNLLVHFAKSIQQIEIRFNLYKTLYNEMSSNDRNDIKKLLQLTECIKTEILDRETNATAVAAQSLLDIICIDDIMQHLQSNELALAVQKLQMGNEKTYKYAVSKIYYNQDGSLEASLRLANSVPDAEKKLIIYDALYNEMIASGYNDSRELFQLTQSIKTEILGQTNDTVAIAAQLLIDRINHNEIINYLKYHQFALAEQKLINCTDDVYTYVVKETQFDTLFNFADSVRDFAVKFKLYNVLYKETKNYTLQKNVKVLRLHSSLKNALGPVELLFDAFKIVFDKTAEQIAAGFIEDVKGSEGRELSNEISNVDSHILYSVYESVIDKIGNKLTLHEVLNRTYSYTLRERMAAHEAITNKLQRMDDLASYNKTILLARQMKEVRDDFFYNRTVPQYLQSRYKELENKLSPTVKNMVFSSKVCIKNTAYNEYLYASENTHDGKNRYIYTIPLEDTNKNPASHKWRVDFQRHDNIIGFLNDNFQEYLFLYWKSFDRNKQFALANKTKYRSSQWEMQDNEDAVYIKNFFDREYLFADDKEKSDDGKRYVFSFQDKHTKPPNSKWEIVDCS